MDKYKKHKSFYFIIAIVGLALMMLEVGIYRKTIIPLKIPFLVILIVSIFGFFTIQNDYRQTYQNKNFFFPFAQSLLSFGFIACYLFMALNFYLADSTSEKKLVPILTKHTIGTKNIQPAIEIDYDGVGKQLVFYSGEQAQLDTSRHVLLTVRKGLFGFDIFTDITLK